ncbi:methylcrotonoyl-CoA carboxylase [Xanthomonas sp. GW]|nr:methylcrotonoyl-CoA carboxylase [Xanthomonas sp. GW]
MRYAAIESKGGSWSAENETTFKTPIREQFEQRGHPYYASVRFCDDVAIDPVQT